jgi:hypothetical protein
MSEIVILGAQHETSLRGQVVDYDQPRSMQLRVLLEDYEDSYGRTERRLATYELDNGGRPAQRIGYLPKYAPRRTGEYLATLHLLEGKRRIEGNLSRPRQRSDYADM